MENIIKFIKKSSNISCEECLLYKVKKDDKVVRDILNRKDLNGSFCLRAFVFLLEKKYQNKMINYFFEKNITSYPCNCERRKELKEILNTLASSKHLELG